MSHVVQLSIFIPQQIKFNIFIFIVDIFILMINLYLNILISFITIHYIIVDIFYAFFTQLIDVIISAFSKYGIFMLVNVSGHRNYRSLTPGANNPLALPLMSILILIIVIFILLEIQQQNLFYQISLIFYSQVNFECVI